MRGTRARAHRPCRAARPQSGRHCRCRYRRHWGGSESTPVGTSQASDSGGCEPPSQFTNIDDVTQDPATRRAVCTIAASVFCGTTFHLATTPTPRVSSGRFTAAGTDYFANQAIGEPSLEFVTLKCVTSSLWKSLRLSKNVALPRQIRICYVRETDITSPSSPASASIFAASAHPARTGLAGLRKIIAPSLTVITPCQWPPRRPGIPSTALTRDELEATDHRFLFDCATTLPARVLVTGDDFRLSSARDALSSVLAPVCAWLPAWRKAEPASVFWIALDEPLPSFLPATVATRDDVCLLFLAM